MNAIVSGLRKDPERRIRVAYRLALLVMAILLSGSYFALNAEVERGSSYAVAYRDINKERLLAQRTVLLSQRALGDEDPAERGNTLDALNASIAELKQRHESVLEQAAELQGKTAVPQRVYDTLFAWPSQLDYYIRSLIQNTEQLAQLAESSPKEAADYLGRIEAVAASSVLPALDDLADVYRGQTVAAISRFERIHLTILVTSLCLLALGGLFLFRPLARQIGESNRELIAARDEMRFAATHDSLTGLANRDFALDLIQERTAAGSEQSSHKTAIFLLDLDDFKAINDSFGHLQGDKLLRLVASRLNTAIGGSGVACRMGGDEFLIVVTDPNAMADLSTVAGKVLTRLNGTVQISGVPTKLQASIGIARFPSDGIDTEELLAAADVALYAAKAAEKGTFRFFTEELRKKLDDSRSLEQEIDRAIVEGQFRPVFQPQLNLATGHITGVEVLVRWHHPKRGVLRPAEFLAAAASFGRMPDITRLVIDQAFDAAAEWQSKGIEFGRIGVNFSTYDLMWNGFFRSIAQAADEYGLAYDRVSVEVVESVAIESDGAQSALALYELRRLGMHIEVDDFGTGFASLSHLNRDLFDRVKIDRQFVSGIDSCDRIRIIVDSIIRLSSALNIKVIAEGVETADEIEALMELGCNEFQGNAIAPPMPADVVRDWLATYQRTGLAGIAAQAKAG
ncbi:MAG: EAL domain-containing protein [Pseudomonadota bacterium]